MTALGFLLGVKPIAACNSPCLARELAEAGHAPNLAGDIPVVAEQLGSGNDLAENRTGSQQANLALRRRHVMGRDAVHAL